MAKFSLSDLSENYLNAARQMIKERLEEAMKKEYEKAVAEIIPRLQQAMQVELVKKTGYIGLEVNVIITGEVE